MKYLTTAHYTLNRYELTKQEYDANIDRVLNDNNSVEKDYRYFQGESICPSEDFVSQMKSSFWMCESDYYTQKEKLSKEFPTPYDYARRYCNAIADKWMCGSGLTGDDIFEDYLHPDIDSLTLGDSDEEDKLGNRSTGSQI